MQSHYHITIKSGSQTFETKRYAPWSDAEAANFVQCATALDPRKVTAKYTDEGYVVTAGRTTKWTAQPVDCICKA